MIDIEWGTDVYATRSVRVGPLLLFSTHPVNGWGHRKPRTYLARWGGWQLTLERYEKPSWAK